MGEVMIEVFQIVVGVVIVCIMACAVYIGVIVQEEVRQGKRIPLLWEKGGFLYKAKSKVFDKSDIKYRDGDNT